MKHKSLIVIASSLFGVLAAGLAAFAQVGDPLPDQHVTGSPASTRAIYEPAGRVISATVTVDAKASPVHIWHIETVEGAGGIEWGTSLVLDGQGRPHISYTTGYPNYDLKYAQREAAGHNGASWHIETIDHQEGGGDCTASLALDGSGRPHISYQAGYPNNGLKYVWGDGRLPLFLSKAASLLDGLTNRDIVTYTLTLSGAGQSAYLWDPLPMGVYYVSGSLTSTLSPPAVYSPTARTVTWQGALSSTLGLVRFQATRGITGPGSLNLSLPIVNTAWLTDTDNGTHVEAAVIVNGYHLFLPSISTQQVQRVTFGIDFGPMTFQTATITYDFPLAKQMGTDWLRLPLPWSSIEITRGQYDWESFDRMFARLQELGFEPLPIIHGPPEWAAKLDCGPISDTLAFELFLEAAATRYGPFVDAWEFTNEPDSKLPQGYPLAGCWGYQPRAYAEQLGLFYTTVKRLDPTALVVLGGLAYDNWEVFERSFFSETLASGAGRFFDVANLHYYPINPAEFPTMAHKVNEIKAIMARYGVFDKRIWVTETGMWINDLGFEPLKGSLELQRNFIVREYARGFSAGVDNIFWFDPVEQQTGPRRVHRWLISANHEPAYGYPTFQNMASKVANTAYAGRYQALPANVEAYTFTAPGRTLYIMWSNTLSTTVSMPAATDATLTDRDGQLSRVLAAQAGQVSLEIGTTPVFLEFPSSTK